MQCPYCHAENQDGRFCDKCGKPLDQDVSDMTRVMPPLNELRQNENMESEDESAREETLAKTDEENNSHSENDDAPAEDTANTDTDTIAEETLDENASKDDAAAEDTTEKPPLPAFLLENDEEELAALIEEDEGSSDRRKKLLTAVALVIGIALAAIAAVYLFTDLFDTTPPADPTEQVKNADTIAPDTSLAEDTIVGHWRHYNTGSVIEKIGTARYRWTIGKQVYPLDFKDNVYVYEDENGNIYNFVLTDADHIQLASSSDASGGLITNPAFESGFIAGRVGQDGTMAKSMAVNGDAFNIIGKTYAELAGTYGPGALSVVGDDQYIVFRAEGGNFAVRFEGETVPLAAEAKGDYELSPLAGTSNYSVVPLSYNNTTSTTPESNNNGTTDEGTTTTPPDNNNNNNTTTTPPVTTTTPPSSSADSNDDDDENTEYTVEIPDMPTFPSTTSVATGVVWADLGFVIKNAPDTMTVEDLSAVLGIALEVGTAPANESGFSFFGMDEGYFAGTYAYGDHSFYISGYGKSALEPDKTILFIQMIS